eukprot:scaffold272529_cov12-Tisochrysis_lutea.AAC.1
MTWYAPGSQLPWKAMKSRGKKYVGPLLATQKGKHISVGAPRILFIMSKKNFFLPLEGVVKGDWELCEQ